MNPDLLPALGWAFLHSLWQLALVGLAAAALLAALGRGRPGASYVVACLALLACLGVPTFTFIHHLHREILPVLAGLDPAPFVAAPGAAGGPAPALPLSWGARILAFLAEHVSAFALVWALGALIMGLRLGGGWMAILGWRREALPAPGPWEDRFRALARQMGAGGRVVLRTSTRVATPVALGLWRPVVLVPTALFTRMPEAYLEALLAHELAHGVRLDFPVNLLQSVIEVLCFHHPVVWWLSRRVRTLREHLCDDLAAKAIGEPRRLALALDALDDVQPHLTHLALAARGGPLYERIHRLLNPEARRGTPWAIVPLLALLLPCATLALRAAETQVPPIAINAEAVAQLDALAAREGLDPQLLRSVAWAESDFNPIARSPRGALGLLQVMPETARRFGATDLNDEVQVRTAGVRYLKFLLARYQGDVAKAVTAYNCGEQALDAGHVDAEATNYRALVLDLLKARAVQPEAPLEHGWVRGTLRPSPDGSSCSMRLRMSTLAGLFVVELLPLDPDGHAGAKALGSIVCGGDLPAKDAWVESSPRIMLAIPRGTSFLVRARSTNATRAILGETRLVLDAPWKAFAFPMDTRIPPFTLPPPPPGWMDKLITGTVGVQVPPIAPPGRWH